jgi:AcrR family transcriptional regulator
MARPPSGTDLKLKAAGSRLLQEKGITGLSVREVCRQAGVNTGMFHYYFGSKEEFLKAVLKEMYAGFMLNFKAEVAVAGTPRARLRAALVEVGKFARAIRKAAPMLLADMSHGKKEAFTFLSGNLTEHLHHIAALAEECRSASALKDHSVPFIVGTLIPVMVFPVIIGGIMERNGVKELGGLKMPGLVEEFLCDSGIGDRAEAALRGIGL